MEKIILLMISISFSAPCFAQGMIDFLDPCIEAKQDIKGQLDTLEKHRGAARAEIASSSATQEVRGAFVSDLKKEARKIFDETRGIKYAESGMSKDQIDKVFEVDFKVELEKYGEESLTAAQDDIYRTAMLARFDQSLKEARAKDEKAKQELKDACPTDVGNQIIRATATVIAAPFDAISRNWEAAKNEKGFGETVVKATTGVDVSDAIKYPVRGGPSSEVSKALNEAEKVGKKTEKEIRNGLKKIGIKL